MRFVPRGYIAFTSAVVMSAVLLLLATVGSMRSWYIRSNALDREHKLRSDALAEGCVEYALLRFAKDPIFTGSTTLAFGGGACAINSVVTMGAQKKFIIHATYQAAHTRVRISTDQTFKVTSWEEIPI